MRPQDVLTYWFGDLESPEDWNKEATRKWFMSTAQDDAEITQRFGGALEAAGRGEYDAWAEEPRGRLALVLLLDQMSRNVFRGQAQAFSHDARAYELARQGVERGDDARLWPLERAFLYMPYEHQESLEVQREAIRLMEPLGADMTGPLGDHLRQYVTSAVQHAGIIEQFGRFPHRNRVLGRESTPQEVAYLEGGGATFGQDSK